jgi:hypothetical protein
MDQHLAGLDWLLGMLGKTPATPNRSLEERIKGAIRLWKRQLGAALVPAVCLLASWGWLIMQQAVC